MPLRVRTACFASRRHEKLPDVAGTQPRDAARRPNAAISSAMPAGTAGKATVTSDGTRRARAAVAHGVKDDRVRDERVLVYSTDGTLPLPKPAKRTAPHGAHGAAKAMPDDGVVRVARERRRNSALTLVHGLSAGELDAEAKALKRLCGTGGTAKNGVVELQGDHRDAVVAYFEQRGRRVKRAGG